MELRDKLEAIMEECEEEPHLYFQAPESVKMEYPAIRYNLSTLTSDYADDTPYHNTVSFEITYITRSPSSKVPHRLLKEPMLAFDRHYRADNLYHYVYMATNTLKEVEDD